MNRGRGERERERERGRRTVFPAFAFSIYFGWNLCTKFVLVVRIPLISIGVLCFSFCLMVIALKSDRWGWVDWVRVWRGWKGIWAGFSLKAKEYRMNHILAAGFDIISSGPLLCSSILGSASSMLLLGRPFSPSSLFTNSPKLLRQ